MYYFNPKTRHGLALNHKNDPIAVRLFSEINSLPDCDAGPFEEFYSLDRVYESHFTDGAWAIRSSASNVFIDRKDEFTDNPDETLYFPDRDSASDYAMELQKSKQKGKGLVVQKLIKTEVVDSFPEIMWKTAEKPYVVIVDEIHEVIEPEQKTVTTEEMAFMDRCVSAYAGNYHYVTGLELSPEEFAKNAFDMAEAMLKRRRKFKAKNWIETNLFEK